MPSSLTVTGPAGEREYTVPEAALRIRRSEQWLRAEITRGNLRAVKRGRFWIVTASALAELLSKPVTIPGLKARWEAFRQWEAAQNAAGAAA